MNSDLPNQPTVFPIARAMLWLAAATLFMAGVIFIICNQLGFEQQAQLNTLAAAVCGGAGIIGLLPVWALSRHSTHGSAQGFMAGILFRMLVAGGVVIWAQWGAKVPWARDFSMWIGVWYILILLVEVKLVSSHVLAVAPGPARHPSEPEAPQATPATAADFPATETP